MIIVGRRLSARKVSAPFERDELRRCTGSRAFRIPSPPLRAIQLYTSARILAGAPWSGGGIEPWMPPRKPGRGTLAAYSEGNSFSQLRENSMAATWYQFLFLADALKSGYSIIAALVILFCCKIFGWLADHLVPSSCHRTRSINIAAFTTRML